VDAGTGDGLAAFGKPDEYFFFGARLLIRRPPSLSTTAPAREPERLLPIYLWSILNSKLESRIEKLEAQKSPLECLPVALPRCQPETKSSN